MSTGRVYTAEDGTLQLLPKDYILLDSSHKVDSIFSSQFYPLFLSLSLSARSSCVYQKIIYYSILVTRQTLYFLLSSILSFSLSAKSIQLLPKDYILFDSSHKVDSTFSFQFYSLFLSLCLIYPALIQGLYLLDSSHKVDSTFSSQFYPLFSPSPFIFYQICLCLFQDFVKSAMVLIQMVTQNMLRAWKNRS